MKWTQVIFGVGIILIGSWLLLYNLGIISFLPWNLWSLIPLGIGLLLHGVAFSNKKDFAVLIPAGLLTTIGVLFFACQIFGWDILEYLWPVFPLAAGIGFLEAYLFGGRQVEFLIPAAPTLGVGIIGLSATLKEGVGRWLLPLVLIVIGLLVLMGPRRSGERP